MLRTQRLFEHTGGRRMYERQEKVSDPEKHPPCVVTVEMKATTRI